MSAGKISMAKKKSTSRSASQQIKTFAGLIRGRAPEVQRLAKALRALVLDEMPTADESFHSGRDALALYRTAGEVCWIQPLSQRCNVYFPRGTELTDDDEQLEGTGDRQRHVKVYSVEHMLELPLPEWIRESLELNAAAIGDGPTFDEVLDRVRLICLVLPHTQETITWGRPFFRVGEKIFCGCTADHGRTQIRLKMEPREATLMIRVPGVEKAAYSRPNDGWVTVDPAVFDDWDEISRLLVDSFRLVAPKKIAALLD